MQSVWLLHAHRFSTPCALQGMSTLRWHSRRPLLHVIALVPSVFVMCKWSKTEGGNGLEMRLSKFAPCNVMMNENLWYITWQSLLICIQSANVVPFITKETHFKLILAVSICFLFHEVLHNLIVTFLCCIMEWGHLQMNTRYTYQSEYRPASHHHYV